MEKTFYTLEQLAKMLAVSERTITREVKSGKLRAFKVGRALRFTSEAVMAMNLAGATISQKTIYRKL
jgi:excisionase family DNA binding protein